MGEIMLQTECKIEEKNNTVIEVLEFFYLDNNKGYCRHAGK